MGDKGNEIALRQVRTLNFVVQLCIRNRNCSTVTQLIEKCQVALRVAGTLKQYQANHLSLPANRNNDLGMRNGQNSFCSIAKQRNLARLPTLNGGAQAGQFERHM